MRDSVTKDGHAEGCDGKCGDVHDKASAVHAIEQSLNVIRADKDNPLTPDGNRAMEFGLTVVREIRDDPTIGENETTLMAIQTIFIRTCQIAGILDLLRKSSGQAPSLRLN